MLDFFFVCAYFLGNSTWINKIASSASEHTHVIAFNDSSPKSAENLCSFKQNASS